jgi:hypothetical protein
MAGRLGLVVVLLAALLAVAALGTQASPPKSKGVPGPQPPSKPGESPPQGGGGDESPTPPTPGMVEGPPVSSWKTTFKIKPRTPVKGLLPAAPKGKPAPVYVGDDLTRVTEIVLEAPPSSKLSKKAWTKRIGHNMAKVDHLNNRRKDGFIKALVAERSDLAGLPFLLGDACRMSGVRVPHFEEVATAVRSAGDNWDQVRGSLDGLDKEAAKQGRRDKEHSIQARVAALSQIMGPSSVDGRMGFVKYLAAVPRKEATAQLARVAVFDDEKKVREAAVEQLSVRRERDYTDVLVKALRYPWPAVAKNAADAIVKLERKDLLAELVAVLEEPDPREPRTEKVGDKKATVANELVRINHHKSCLLCHAPADGEKVGDDVFMADVPLPSEPLPSPSDGYQQSEAGLLVRIDMTYLRQDFSVMQSVKDADPWPAEQRFDFLVRKRLLSDDEAKDLGERLNKREEGELSPYHRAAVGALRELTGRDVEAKAATWRKLLKLPAKQES